MIGVTVGSYRVTQKVSVGGMGTVYRAEHALIGKPAAVKVLHPELRGNPEVVQRFFNEAKATTQIKHPGIVEIFDFGYLDSGDGYIVMEFLDGMSLARRLETGGTMEEGEAAMLMKSVCNALSAAHAKGIIHRDLKPDNLFLCPDPDAPTGERPKLLDFGIAKLNAGLSGPVSATKTGAVMGTPTYMSPEQCRGTGEVDARSDLYSIGCLFYEMVAGRPPFDNMATGELIGAHLFIEPESPRTAGAQISDAAESLVMQLLSKQPAKRVQTAQELARRFAELAQGAGLTLRATPMPTTNHKVTRRDATGEGVMPTLPSDPGLSTPGVRSSALARAASSPGVSPTASSVRGSAAVPSEHDSGPIATSQPTTLSGAASQSAAQPVVRLRSRAGLFAGLGAAFLIAGGAAFVVVSNNTKPAASGAAEPTAVPAVQAEPAVAADQAPTAHPPADATADPAPAPPAADVPAPAAVPAVEPPAPDVTAKPEPAKPEPTKPRPTAHKPKLVKPRPDKAQKTESADKTDKSDKAKPGDKTDKPKPAEKPKTGILIETDL
jgi:eukaryotic-like serine/threonine-protein kinase